MSVQVASQTRKLPLDHGVKDKLSGCDQSEDDKPEGSRLDRILAESRKQGNLVELRVLPLAL